LEYNPRTLLGNLFADIPNDRKTKIALIVLVQNISKEEAKTLALPLANKRAKSLTGVAIPKRGGKENKKGKASQRVGIKKEVVKEAKEEDNVKIKEIEEDNKFPKVNKIVKGKCRSKHKHF
jgi:hypothetical protein